MYVQQYQVLTLSLEVSFQYLSGQVYISHPRYRGIGLQLSQTTFTASTIKKRKRKGEKKSMKPSDKTRISKQTLGENTEDEGRRHMFVDNTERKRERDREKLKTLLESSNPGLQNVVRLRRCTLVHHLHTDPTTPTLVFEKVAVMRPSLHVFANDHRETSRFTQRSGRTSLIHKTRHLDRSITTR